MSSLTWMVASPVRLTPGLSVVAFNLNPVDPETDGGFACVPGYAPRLLVPMSCWNSRRGDWHF